MKKFILYTLLCISTFLGAQDQLFKKDNSKVDVKILEINQTEIKYKLFTYQEGPTITIAKKDVALIIYQNGVHEVISSTTETPTSPQTEQPTIVYSYTPSKRINYDSIEIKKVKELTSTKNLVSINVLDMLNSSFSISYLREFANSMFNVYVPVSFGFSEPFGTQTLYQSFNSGRYSYNGYVTDFRFTKKTVETGIGINFQTSGNKAVTHFIGPYIGVAQFEGTFKDYTYNSSYYDPNTGNYIYVEPDNATHGFVMNRYYFMLNNGILFRATKNFNIMMLLGLGYKQEKFVANNPEEYLKLRYGNSYNNNYYNYYNFYSSFPINSIKFGLTFGYRF